MFIIPFAVRPDVLYMLGAGAALSTFTSWRPAKLKAGAAALLESAVWCTPIKLGRQMAAGPGLENSAEMGPLLL
jgi:hypothetical protein